MSSELPSRELSIELARSVLDATSSLLPFEATADTPEHVVWAGAFVARCRQLLWGLVSMVECGADDAVGALSRTLFETFLNGTYVLLGREEAAEVMGRSYIHEVHQLQVALNQRGKQDKPDEAEKLHISRYDEQDGLVERVDRLLADHDERYRGWVPEMHRRHYKVLSFQDAHGSLGCLRGYVDIDNPPERVSATRGEPTTAVFLLHHAIADVGSFAGLWGMKVGEDLSALHAALERWEQTQPDAWDPVPSD